MMTKKRYGLFFSHADEEIRQRCEKRARLIYGDRLPDTVEKRLSFELSKMSKYGYASDFLIAMRIADKSKELGFHTMARGTLGSSFISYLCGISMVNPMHAYYLCSNCHHFEMIEADFRKHGFDYPDKKCPACGKTMKPDGAIIMDEIYMGKSFSREPIIVLNVAPSIRKTIVNYFEELVEDNILVRAGTSVEWPDGKKYKGVHPGGFFICPKEMCDGSSIEIRNGSRDEFGLLISSGDYHLVDSGFKRYDILELPLLDLLHELEYRTSMCSDDVKLNSREIIELFQKEGFEFIPGETVNEENYILSEQPEVSQRINQFSDIARFSGLVHQNGTWWGKGGWKYPKEKTIQEQIACRDDILQYFSIMITRDYAYESMNRVVHGKGIIEPCKDVFRNMGIPEQFIRDCQELKYAFPKSHLYEYVILYSKLAFYKIKYPSEYMEI